MAYSYKTAIGQDSHRFADLSMSGDNVRKLMLGGVQIPDFPALAGNSDADVILHALTNAVSGITGINILGTVADELCQKEGITDSSVYLAKAVAGLGSWEIFHISISIEAKKPHLSAWIPAIRKSVALLTGLDIDSVGLTATSGEELTEFGLGRGIQVFCVVTVRRQE
jgi:2-C-methyl-D-erythritol 2,4-cyclodiphosphate synthase